MARWPNESSYDVHIRSAMTAAGLSSSLLPIVKGIIGVESGFVASAIRQEPSYDCKLTGQVGDASRGLMQVLYCTARGMGFSGTTADMFDPLTNVTLGVSYLKDRLRAHNGDVWAAVSAYNNGHGRTATATTTVCLERGAGGVCTRSFTAQPGQFLNQPYVDKVRDAAAYFGDVTGGAQPLPPIVVVGTPDPVAPSWAALALLAGVVLGGVLLFDAVSS